MSTALWAEIARRVDSHEYMTGVERTVARVAATGEVFTPTALVLQMLRSQRKGTFGPGRTVLDQACGDGQFLVAVKWLKVLQHDMSEAAALADIYGVDVMRDNVDLCRRRLLGHAPQLGSAFDDVVLARVVMGNFLQPAAPFDAQTAAEHRVMRELYL